MKKLFLFFVLTITVTFVYGQKTIDALFDRYAGKAGFVTVTISGNLLKFTSCFDDDNDENAIPSDITEIRILAQKRDNTEVENFYDMVKRDIYLNNYEEFMRVKESDQDLWMLVRSEGNRFKEFLLIAEGEDNALVLIKGNMTYEEARKFSRKAKDNHGLNIISVHK